MSKSGDSAKSSVFVNCLSKFFSYSTDRSAAIRSTTVGIVYRIVQFIIFIYVVGYELIHNKGYQITDTPSSSVTTKVKGQGFVPINIKRNDSNTVYDQIFFSNAFSMNPNYTYKMLDTADYIIPPNEFSSIFIMTNFLKTEQSQGFCDEETGKHRAICKSDKDCQEIGFVSSWNGIPTGRCINSSVDKNLKVCEIRGWCPVEHESYRDDDGLIRNVLNFTLFLKNDVDFKRFNRKLRNILPTHNNRYISLCTFERTKDPHCPVFKLDDILSEIEPSEKEKYEMLMKGAVILIEIIWNCDLDFNKPCYPKYFFKRFDQKATDTASGFNFRFADKFRNQQKEYRILYKAYGLRFIINISGTAGKFYIVPLMLTIGAGFGLMSISVIVADCVMLHCTKDKKLYQQVKKLKVDESINVDSTDEPNEITRL